MVYYHGGGFVIPGSDRHLDMLLRFVEFSNNNLAIFAVAYTLSPGAVYPTAIGQSVEALRYIVSLPGHSADTTLIGGDSAGGNLAVAVQACPKIQINFSFKCMTFILPFILRSGETRMAFLVCRPCRASSAAHQILQKVASFVYAYNDD